MRYFEDEKPPLDELAHFGVKGMKWGTRKAATGADIRKARREMSSMRSIRNVADARVRQTARGTAERTRAVATRDRIDRSIQKDPNRALAARLTKGEMVASVLIGGPVGLIPIVGSQLISRRIQGKQEAKAYNKK